MMFMQIIYFFIFFTTIICREETIISWTEKRHFCGSDIPVVMGLVCTYPKRHSRHINNTLEFKDNQRRKRGITDECCTQTCSLLEMQDYCHIDTELTSTNVTIIWSRSIGGYGTSATPTVMPTTAATTTTTTESPFCYCCPIITISFH